jgi:hypothetical protein
MPSTDPNERILLTGTAPGGDRFDLVAYGDGGCGISRNGLPDADRQWVPCELDASTLALMRALGLE